MDKEKYILLTIDVEDWFQVENFKPWVPFETWDQRELRVEQNTHRLLNLFDSIELKAPQLNRFHIQRGRHSSKLKEANDSTDSINPTTPLEAKSEKKEGISIQSPENSYQLSAMSYEKSHPKATFFILGWIAERLPNLVREIHTRGHEIASHGYNHNLCNQQSHSDLKRELTESKKLLEDISGAPAIGFRASNFSVNNDVLKIVEDCGYLYDSSYNSFGIHGRYGHITLNGSGRKGIAHKIAENFYELPISNLQLVGQTFPWGGGGYFRLIPYCFFKQGIQSILKKDGAYMFYMHPWEIDADQPRVESASTGFKLRHYVNLRNTQSKLKKLIESFSYCRLITCKHYLSVTI